MAEMILQSDSSLEAVLELPAPTEFLVEGAFAGPQGPPGQAGPGIAPGGLTGDFLVKASGRDFDTRWVRNTNNSAIFLTVGQTNHGFFLGELVYFDGTRYVPALADNLDHAEVNGIVSKIVANDVFVLTTEGYVTDLQNMAAGGIYFLSDTEPGHLTLTEPTTVGHVSKPVFTADSLTSGFFHNYRGQEI